MDQMTKFMIRGVYSVGARARLGIPRLIRGRRFRGSPPCPSRSLSGWFSVRLAPQARRDSWWVQPLVVFLGLTTFLVYSGWAAFQGNPLHLRSVSLAPSIHLRSHRRFASQLVRAPSRGASQAWLPFSPALLILPIPGLFRLTCYYYRGAYYKAFLGRSAVVYRRRAPIVLLGRALVSRLILQNGHRYALFLDARRSCSS